MLLVAGAVVVARRVRAWDAPAIGVDAVTAAKLDARVVALHVPLCHEAAVTVAALDDLPRASPSASDGWLARARRDGKLVAAAVRAAMTGEADPIEDAVVSVALGRMPAPVDEGALDLWQSAQEARQQENYGEFAQHIATDPGPDPLDRSVDELELSVRTANALANLRVLTLRDLCARSKAALKREGKFTGKSIAELESILDELGLSLAEE